MLFRYGEEPRARQIAAAIVRARATAPITTTRELAELVAAHAGRQPERPHPSRDAHVPGHSHRAQRRARRSRARRSRRASALLAERGRLVVISFHSLEDRIVKRFMAREARGDEAYAGLPNIPPHARPRLKLVGKLVRPGEGGARAQSARAQRAPAHRRAHAARAGRMSKQLLELVGVLAARRRRRRVRASGSSTSSTARGSCSSKPKARTASSIGCRPIGGGCRSSKARMRADRLAGRGLRRDPAGRHRRHPRSRPDRRHAGPLAKHRGVGNDHRHRLDPERLRPGPQSRRRGRDPRSATSTTKTSSRTVRRPHPRAWAGLRDRRCRHGGAWFANSSKARADPWPELMPETVAAEDDEEERASTG